MRIPIAVRIPLFDVKTVQGEIDAICSEFDHYLSFYPTGTSTSKHAVMGPVGKVISEVKSGRDDRTSLKGYALRVHETKQQFPSPDSIAALSAGIDKLIDLLGRDDVPIVARDRILDRIDYGLYYLRRKQQIEGRERYNDEFREYLKHRYDTLEALSVAWTITLDSWQRVHAFGRAGKEYARANLLKRKDMDEFRDARRRTTAAPDVEIEDEEETP